VLVEQPDARLLDSPPLVAVRLVRDHGAQHPIRDRLAVHRRVELRLGLGEPLLVRAGQVPQEALAREPPELGGRALHLLRRLQRRQLLVAVIDLLDVERLLQPCEVEVVLLVEVGDEPVATLAERVELAACRGDS
jgi:hypothetical protein